VKAIVIHAGLFPKRLKERVDQGHGSFLQKKVVNLCLVLGCRRGPVGANESEKLLCLIGFLRSDVMGGNAVHGSWRPANFGICSDLFFIRKRRTACRKALLDWLNVALDKLVNGRLAIQRDFGKGFRKFLPTPTKKQAKKPHTRTPGQQKNPALLV